MRPGLWRFSCALTVLLAVTPAGALAAAYTFTSIDVPFQAPVQGRITSTAAFGINDAGQIVGDYAAGGPPPNVFFGGFLYSAGVFSAISVPFPGATATRALGINAAGQIVGDYNPMTSSHGFLDNGGIFSSINVPFARATGTSADGINAAGQIVGAYFDATFRTHGFLDNGGMFSTIDPPFPAPFGTEASGINIAGQIVGVYVDSTSRHGFLDTGGIFNAINVPFPGASNTDASGINDFGQIVGSYQSMIGFHGFLDNGGNFSTIDVPFPGVINTFARGINNFGQIVGSYVDATAEHGFLATPVLVPEPPSLFLLGSVLAVLAAGACGRTRFRALRARDKPTHLNVALPAVPSTCQVGLAGCRRWRCALGIYDQPMLQISAQTWNVWVLEARCSAAVT
jgi:uncharacterized membrane protein